MLFYSKWFSLVVMLLDYKDYNQLSSTSWLHSSNIIETFCSKLNEIEAPTAGLDSEILGGMDNVWYPHFFTYESWSFDKSKVQVQVQAGDWVLLKSDFPASHHRKVSEKQDAALYPIQKVSVYTRRLWNMFWNKPRPKIHPLRVQKGWKPLI